MKPVLLIALAAAAWAQPLTVYSEFARIDDKGKVTAPEFPREILSPAVVRNGFTSFQIIVTEPDATPWQLYVAQNPENAVRVTLYRKTGENLELVTQPASGTGTQVFWMDLWAERGASVSRIKVEPQLHVNNDWVIYPMEARIMAASVLPANFPAGTAAPAEVMRGFLCGTKLDAAPAAGAPTTASLRFRNAQQDRALANGAPREALQKAFGACETQPPASDPEWYLRVRDFLFRQ